MNPKQMRAAALKAAQELINGAKAAARDLTDDERSTVEAKFAEVEDLDAKIKAAEDSDALMARLGSFGAPEGSGDREVKDAARSLGEHFAKSIGPEGFARLKERGGFTVSAPEFKANTDPQLVPGSLAPVLTQIDRTIVQGFRRPTVADVMSAGSISGNAVSYFVEGAFEGTIATVAENGQKPQIHVADPTAVTDSLKKIAAWWDTSDEMVEDVDVDIEPDAPEADFGSTAMESNLERLASTPLPASLLDLDEPEQIRKDLVFIRISNQNAGTRPAAVYPSAR